MGTAVTTATEQRSLRFGVRGLIGVLLLAALAFAPPVMPARAATLTVMNCADSGSGSLRQAVADATSGDTIIFALDCTGITAGTTTTPGYIAFGSTINITQTVTIDATVGRHTITLDGGNATQLLFVSAGVSPALVGLTLAHGAGLPAARSATWAP